jgi:hypothetical protein
MEQLLILALILACPLMITHAPFMRFARTKWVVVNERLGFLAGAGLEGDQPRARSAVGPPT